MRVRVLGTVDVENVDESKLGGPKQRTVLAVLALAGGRSVPVSTLVDAVWGDDQPTSAVKSVQTYIARLRALLGDHIEGGAAGYRLDLDVDLAHAESLVARAVERRAAGDVTTAAELLDRAIDQWNGRSLTGVATTPWTIAETARLEELRAAWTEERADTHLVCGRHVELIPELEALVSEEPLRERRWALLITALYRGGRQADALRAYQRLRSVLADELGIDPSPELRALEAAVLAQDPALNLAVATSPEPPRVDAARAILPSPAGHLIGRESELSSLGVLVARDDIRLVTITGPGGSGKTRLAVELAQTAAGAFADGAAFVELAPVADPQLVLTTIAAALGVEGDALSQWLSERELLLVVDNVEHVIDAAADLAALFREGPDLTMVVTSRRILRVRGEHVFPLGPLPADAAVELFVERATQSDPTLEFNRSTVELTRQICARVDNLPLAVELAAARTSILTLEALLDGLRDRLTLLGPAPRDAPERQQTLAATLAWSTDLLTAAERRTLGRLSVFAGGCSVEAAMAVCEATVDELTALVDSSLIRREAIDTGSRIVMLETIREHAADLLTHSGDDRVRIEAAHAAYYTEVAEHTVLKGPGALAGLRTIDRELDNLRMAYDHEFAAARVDVALRIATGLYRYWYVRGLHREGRERISRPFERGGGDATVRAMALRALAGFAFVTGHRDEACQLAERGVVEGTSAGVPEAMMACHTVLGLAAIEQADFGDARHHLEASAALASEHGYSFDLIIANTNLAEVALRAGDLDEAERRYHESAEWCEQNMDQPDVWALLGLGVIAYLRDDVDIAVDRLNQAHDLALDGGDPQRAAVASIWLAATAARRDDHAEAARLLGRAAAALEATGGALDGNDADIYERTTVSVRDALGDETFSELATAGRSTPPTPQISEPTRISVK